MTIDSLKHPPRQARSEAKLDALMNAVEILLREKPYNDVSVAELAAEAGVSPAYLYTRFENKQALMDYVVGRFLTEQKERAAGLLEPERWRGVGLKERLARLANQFSAAAKARPGILRALSEMPSSLDAGDAWINAAAGGQLRDWLLECRNEIAHPNPEDAVTFILQMFALGFQTAPTLSQNHPARNFSGRELVHMAHIYLTSRIASDDIDIGGLDHE